jgi:putative heme-binding domain-containing protein
MHQALTGLVLLLAAAQLNSAPAGQELEPLLLAEDAAALAAAAHAQGEPARGAALFYQPSLNCTKCHAVGDGGAESLGPDLAKLGKEATYEYLVDSILRPSKLIKKGYETITIATADGKSVTGLLAEEQPDRVVLSDPTQDWKRIVISKRDVDARKNDGASVMPAGLVNGLNSRQQFLDLIRYLREIADGGPQRATALRPDPSQVPGLKLPDYESNIDHAGMIASLDSESLKRGEAIYNRVCINCHGTKDRLGSLPSSLRFASGLFKNGNDIYSLYRTLTSGFGQMPPQTWMVPTQKYDVLHYIREAYLKRDNPTQYVSVTGDYLSQLPKGTSRGPKPSDVEPWSAMDYGPALAATIEVGDGGQNFANKGIAIRLDAGPGGVSRGRHWTLFDHDTMRLATAWSGDGFIDWNGINFNGRHEIHPRVVGAVQFSNPDAPGWADPETGAFDDLRLKGRDGRSYGPLPRYWAHYDGQYRHGDQVVLAYTVGDSSVLEMPSVETRRTYPVLSRTFNVGPRARRMVLQVARAPKTPRLTLVCLDPPNHAFTFLGPSGALSEHGPAGATPARGETVGIFAGVSPQFLGLAWSTTPEGDLRLTIPPGVNPLRFTLKVASLSSAADATALASSMTNGMTVDLAPLTHGGLARWPEELKTRIKPGRGDGPFAVDEFELPESNPWLCQLRLTGFDFIDKGRQAAICTWDGDVWLVRGIDAAAGEITWKRIASGLFQPLGLKVRGGNVFVACRDQIVILRDKNGDGETDFYENFNSDHQVTEHFHEFAMGLQTDAAGNFYYAKAARHAKTALVPQHGTLLRVSADGRRTDILATGFRAPNGVCVNDDGTFFLTDEEGFWTPKNRINHVKAGGFYGNMWAYTDVTDTSDMAMEPPVCWITNDFDRSPAELVRVAGDAWGPLKDALLNLSYGNGKIFVVMNETVGDVMQGGMCALPIPALPTGVMRGRFHPRDGQLYASGMFAWAGDRTAPGGFYRIRATGKGMCLPIGVHASKAEMRLTFTDRIDRRSASEPSHYSVKAWSLKRTAEYGSEHRDEIRLSVTAASLSDDGRTITLAVPEIRPTWGMEIRFRLVASSGRPCEGTIHNTIHRLNN